MKYYANCTALFLSVAAFFGGFMTMAKFLSAVPPDVANAGGASNIPSSWEAAYFNHGTYEEWYLISNHPFLFGLTLIAFVGGFASVGYFSRKLGILRGSK